MRLPLIVLLTLTSSSASPAASLVQNNPVADRVILRDGSVMLGQIIPNQAAKRVNLVLRRAWVEEHFPDQAETWFNRDRATRQRALADRSDRLRQWQQERRPPGEGPDRIGSWIDAELARLSDPAATDSFPLLIVSFLQNEVARIDPREEPQRRMLRQGWRAEFEGVESMPEDQLVAGLQARGFALSEIDNAPIENLLPIPAESDRRWLARRASTEALNDSDLRLIRFGDLVLPDPGPGGAVDQQQMAGAVGDLLGNLLGGGQPTNPMKPYLDQIEASGRIGVVVTTLETSPSFDRVGVEATLLIRTAPGRWETGTRRRAEVRPADLPADAGQPLANDPQVRAAFELFQGLGIGQVDPQAQQLGLAVGAATQRALEQARTALEDDLHSVALRIDRGAIPPPADGAR